MRENARLPFTHNTYPQTPSELFTAMACPVNHPWFHALVFFLGVLIVLARYARADEEFRSFVGSRNVQYPALHGSHQFYNTQWIS